MAERKPLSKSIRFEVFKRDSFTCQYCGRSAPEVILHVDHIQPVAKDGDNDIVNLITSCSDCNLGKSDRILSDDAVIVKRKKQLDDLQERREQLEMIYEWQKSLVDLSDIELDKAVEFWDELTPGFSLTDPGIALLKRELKKYGIAETLTSMRICADQYLYDSKHEITAATVSNAFEMIGRIAKNRKNDKEKPYLKDFYYVKGILRNRKIDTDYDFMTYMERAYKAGVGIEELKEIAKRVNSYYQWRREMVYAIESRGGVRG
jgi:hypothetical protein